MQLQKLPGLCRRQRSNNGIFHLRLRPWKRCKKKVAENLYIFAHDSPGSLHKLPVFGTLLHNIEVFKIRSITDFPGCSGQEHAGVRGRSGRGWLKS
jgi:hypothetical protein